MTPLLPAASRKGMSGMLAPITKATKEESAAPMGEPRSSGFQPSSSRASVSSAFSGFAIKCAAMAQAIGLSRGGQTTKIHILADVLGRPAVIRLTPGNISDIRVADELIEAVGPVRRVIADRGYDANSFRRALRSVRTVPIIPGRRSRKCPIRHDERRYRDRWRIEAAFCRLKDFRRVATRYDKLALNFLSAVVLAAIIAFWI